jgi:hypothetical protein
MMNELLLHLASLRARLHRTLAAERHAQIGLTNRFRCMTQIARNKRQRKVDRSSAEAFTTTAMSRRGAEGGLRLAAGTLGMVYGEGCCAAENAVVAELPDGHAVAIGIPKASAAHVDTFAFLFAYNHLLKGIN